MVFVAETTGGHSYLIPSLIGAAVAYAVSGEASVSGDQHLHEMVKIAELSGGTVRDIMQTHVVSVQTGATIRDFRASIAANHRHTMFPVYDHDQVVGTITTAVLPKTDPAQWDAVRVGDLARRDTSRVPADCDLAEALRLLVREGGDQMLLVVDDSDRLIGIVTKTDILRSFQNGGRPVPSALHLA